LQKQHDEQMHAWATIHKGIFGVSIKYTKSKYEADISTNRSLQMERRR